MFVPPGTGGMETSGRFRVQTVGGGSARLVERPSDAGSVGDEEPDAFTPLSVRVDDEAAGQLDPGNVIEATVGWDGDDRDTHDGTLLAWTLVRATRYHVADGVTGLFEAARKTWTAAGGGGPNSRVTRSPDGEPNGALYTFPDPAGRDVLKLLRTGRIPIEPLVARVEADRAPGERAVFLLRPAEGSFVVVYVVFERDGELARTMLETYPFDDGTSSLAGRL